MKKIGLIWVPDKPVVCQDDPHAWTEATALGSGRTPEGKTSKDVVAERTKTERRLCRELCLLRDECLEAAMLEEGGSKAPQRYGIRGGLLPWERETLYKNRRADARARAKENAA